MYDLFAPPKLSIIRLLYRHEHITLQVFIFLSTSLKINPLYALIHLTTSSLKIMLLLVFILILLRHLLITISQSIPLPKLDNIPLNFFSNRTLASPTEV